MNQTYHDLYLKYKKRYISSNKSNENIEDDILILSKEMKEYNEYREQIDRKNKEYKEQREQQNNILNIRKFYKNQNYNELTNLLNNIGRDIYNDDIINIINELDIYILFNNIKDDYILNRIVDVYNFNIKKITIDDLLSKITNDIVIDIIFNNINKFNYILKFDDIFKKYIKKFIKNYSKVVNDGNRQFYIDNINKIINLVKDDNNMTNLLLDIYILNKKYDIFDIYNKLGIKYNIKTYLDKALESYNTSYIEEVILRYRNKIKMNINNKYYKLLVDNVNNEKYDLNIDIIKNPKKLFEKFEDNFDICMIIAIYNDNIQFLNYVDKNLNIINLYKKLKNSEDINRYIDILIEIDLNFNRKIDASKIIRENNLIEIFYYFYNRKYKISDDILREKIKYIVDNNLKYNLYEYHKIENIKKISNDEFKKLVNETKYYENIKGEIFNEYLKKCIELKIIDNIIDRIISDKILNIKDRLMYIFVIYYREINKFKDTFESWFYSIMKDDKQKLLIKSFYDDKFENEYKNKIKEFIKDIETKYEKFIKKSFFSLEKNISKDEPLFN